MKRFFIWLWQLPQHIVGLIGIKITRAYKVEERNDKGWYAEYWCYDCKSRMGGAHGQYILMPCDKYFANARAYQQFRDHEYGHVRQSNWLGVLYYPVVGLFSKITFWMVRWGWITREQRMNMFPEKQADRLGGVTRR